MPVTRSRSGGSRVGATESTSEYTMSTAVADEQGTSQTETTASQRTVPVQRAAPGQGERTQAPLPHTSAQPPLAEQQRRAAQRPLSTLGPAQPPLRTDQRPPQPATGAGEPTLQEQRRQAELRTRPVSSPESPPPAEQGPTRLERPAAPAAPPRSTATTKKSKRTRKLLEAREELLRLQVKLAAAKVAALEADSDSEEDVDTVMEEADHNARVNNWLDTSVPPMPIATEPPLAIASEPHRAPEPPPPLGDIEDRRPQAIEVPQAPAGAGAPAPLHHQVDLSELASAIAQAARSGQHNNNSKMFAELPYFGGSHHEWLSFKAAYFETQSGFTDLENLTRLRRSLKSRAREAVESLLIYNSNPRDVMKILEARFGRPDAIAVAEMEKIRSLPRLADSPRDLCIFASRVTNIVATLKTIGKQRYLLNPEIAKLTMEKLPPAMKYRWYDFAAGQPTDEADIEKLARFLNHEAEICGPYAQPEGVSEPAANRRNHKTFNAQQYEAVNSERHNSESERQYSERQNSERRNSERQNSERKNSDRENSEINRKCVLCSATGHSVAGCAKWRDSNTSQRWDLAKEKRLCFRCLRFRARGHNCKVIKCNIEGCENVHHRTLHYSKRSEEPSEVVGSTWTGKGTQAFLKIVPVQIRGPRKRIDTHALLDDGSTVTLIDEDLAQQAGLRGPREPLHIEAIGSARVDTSASRRLNITLNRSGQGKQHRIRARTIQNLKLSPQSVKLEDIVRCEHLSDIQESVVLHSARPQILIGQDNWHLLVAQEQRIGKRHQPIASLTPLGWVLHGACNRTAEQKVHYTREGKATNRTGARSYKPFVAHRIAEIEENTKIEEWRWVPTKMNVADDGTRDVPRDFDSEHRWFNGPSFLRDDPATWPTEERKIQQDTGEERANLIDRRATKLLEVIPQCDRFSRWERFVRTTARVLQFVDRCRPTTKQAAYARTRANKVADPTWRKPQSRDTRGRGHKKEVQQTEDKFVALPAELLIRAEDLIVRACQEDSFREEIHCLSQHRRVNRDSKLFKIAVELVDGLLTIKTRIAAAEDVPEAVKRPPVLDGRHHIARLYIGHVHRSGHHQGVEATINECRQRFHILGLRPTARSIVHQCTPCRRRRWAPPAPPTGDHPAGRLAHHQRAFTFTGVDYFGPLLTTVGRATKKTYVALFTCLTTRAVHLEMAASLTTDSAVMALRRFVARRGCPRTIWSDNGTNLHGAERELRRAIDNATEEEAAKRRITWRFIPPGAPFMGGAWERLVRSVKTALSAVMDSRPTSEETLATLLAEVEMTVNSRPLTHVSVDPQDPETLTPNHFLLLGPAHAPPAGETSPQDLLGKASWRTAQRLADMFWARWLREYLPELQHRREPHGKGPAVQLGDVVLIADNTLPRNTWPLGRIVATYPGPDDIVRAVDVQTKGGILRRPTKKLVVLQSTTEPANVLPTE